MTNREETKRNALVDEDLKQVTGGEGDGAIPYLYQTTVIAATDFFSTPPDFSGTAVVLEKLIPEEKVRVLDETVYKDYQQREYLKCRKNGYTPEGYILKDALAPQSSK